MKHEKLKNPSFIGALSIFTVFISLLSGYIGSVMSQSLLNGSGKEFLFYSFLATTLLSSVFYVLAHYFNHPLLRYPYLYAAIWSGLILKLALASVLVIAAQLILPFKDIKLVAILVYGCAIIWSVVGYFQAFNPIVRNISINIHNLQDEWKGENFVHISDLHFGHIFNRKFTRDIIKKINKLDPKAVFITGDLVDGTPCDLSGLRESLNKLNCENTFIVTGNHEYIFGLKKFLKAIQKTDITLLDGRIETIDGVNIIGIPHHSSEKNFKFANMLSSLSDRKAPQFLLYHEPRPKDCKKSQREKIDLQLSGHTHNGQIFPLHTITHILFGEYSHGLLNKKGFTQYTTSGVGCWGPPFRTTNKPEIVNFITQ